MEPKFLQKFQNMNMQLSQLCVSPSTSHYALNKKEHRGCDSPTADSSYVLTPNTEEKYKKINEEFDHMMRRHKNMAELDGLQDVSFIMFIMYHH
ncbi:hypothetical protein PAMP_000897 [Pampus punctatissimus]